MYIALVSFDGLVSKVGRFNTEQAAKDFVQRTFDDWCITNNIDPLTGLTWEPGDHPRVSYLKGAELLKRFGSDRILLLVLEYTSR